MTSSYTLRFATCDRLRKVAQVAGNSELYRHPWEQIMKFFRFTLLIVVLALAGMTAAQSQGQTSGEWKAVEDAMGRSGQLQPDGTLKFGMPRKDLTVMLDGTQIKP